jgi:hypothetical protein
MRTRQLTSIGASAVILSVLVVLNPTEMTAQNQGSAAAPKTPWGEPDLQGIWTDETDTPLQRPARFANQEFFTEAQRQELDTQRAAMLNRDTRSERGTARDVSGAYNSEFLSVKRVGARTSLIVDPPDGRIPPLTPEAQTIAAVDREFRLAMLQSTDTCKNEEPACNGGKYDPKPSARRAEPPPRYITARVNRHEIRRILHWPNAASPWASPNSAPHSAAASAASCRRPAASRSSTTSVRVKAGNATSS